MKVRHMLKVLKVVILIRHAMQCPVIPKPAQ